MCVYPKIFTQTRRIEKVMPKFSNVSTERLATCHQDLQTLFHYVIKYYDCTVVCGYRGEKDQNKAYMEGKSQVKYPNSKHNYKVSLAADVAPYDNGRIDWDFEQMYHFAGFVQGIAQMLFDYGAIKHKLRLGADWDGDNDVQDQRFKDLPHFELIK